MGNFTSEQVETVKAFVVHLKNVAAEKRADSPYAIGLIDDAVESFFAEPHAADEQATAYLAQVNNRMPLSRIEIKEIKAAYLAGFDTALPQVAAEMADESATAERLTPNGWASVNA